MWPRQALETDTPEIGARCSAIFTQGVEIRTVLYLLRLRSQIEIERRGVDGQDATVRSLLAEECLALAIRGADDVELVSEEEALSLLSLEPGRNMPDGQKSHLVRQALDSLPAMEDTLDRIAHEQAARLLADHRRIREASDARGLRYNVVPALPIDKIGVYIFMPMASL